MNLFLKGGEVATENAAPTRADVLIENGTITAVGTDLSVPDDARVIDVSGKVVMPGMFDAHVHFREPGQEHKETILDGTEAAINGGITGVVMMPNTAPAIDSATVVNRVLEAGEKCRIPVLTSVASPWVEKEKKWPALMVCERPVSSCSPMMGTRFPMRLF